MKKGLLSSLLLCFLLDNFSCSTLLYSQSPSLDDTSKIVEKVYLHVDRDIYYSGEDIWFKAYLIDALDHLLTNHSHNLHVELISPDLNIISSRIISLVDGLGNGDFKLPDEINSGRYQIRAYTNYMRNFGKQLFFSTEITVISGKQQIEVSDQIKKAKNSIRLDFFPEGGSLIDNVTSVVAFKASGNQEKGCFVSGMIYSSAGDLITTFKSSHLGMGSFLLRPTTGLRYYSIFRGIDSIQHRSELPVSFQKGITMKVTRNQENNLLITTVTNLKTFPLVSDHDMSLIISIRNEVIDSISFKIRSLVTSFTVPTNSFPSGILKLTLIGPEELPLSERLVYIENDAPLKLSIETNKKRYNKREPVILKVSVQGDSMIERSNISMAVVNKNFQNKISQFPRSIASWFMLESDVRGIIEEPSYYFDPSDSGRLKNLDLLLLTQGWRDFAWKYGTTYFPAEDGFAISGKLSKYGSNRPLENSRISLGIFGNWNSLTTTIPVDSLGRFSLSRIDITGEATLVVSGIDKKDRLNGLVVLDSTSYIPAEVCGYLNEVIATGEKNIDNLKSVYVINEAIKKKYKLSDTIPLGEVKIISELRDPQTVKVERSRTFYSKPDDELIVTDASEAYPNVPELMRGKFSNVVVSGPYSGDPEYRIFIRGIVSIHGSIDPLVLINGIEADLTDLIRMPIFEVDRIDILKNVSSTSIYGLHGFNGVINLITKAGGRYADYQEDISTSKLKISGYNAPRIFFSPQHVPDSESTYKPDLRNTLYWDPDINIEGNKEAVLNYYNDDNQARVIIIGEGITSSGIPVTGRMEYEVK